jgi:hypothetical protein
MRLARLVMRRRCDLRLAMTATDKLYDYRDGGDCAQSSFISTLVCQGISATADDTDDAFSFSEPFETPMLLRAGGRRCLGC